MKRLVIVAVACFASQAFAQDPFTPEQRAVIEQIRLQDRAELLEHIKAALSLQGIDIDVDSPTFVTGNAAQPAVQGIDEPTAAAGALSEPQRTEFNGTITDSALAYGRSLRYAPADREFSGVGVGKLEIQSDISIDEDNATASISLSGKQAGSETGKEGDVNIIRGWSLKVSAPIDDQKAGFSHLATLDAFSSGLSAKYRRSWQRTPLGFLKGLAVDDDFKRMCVLSGQPENKCNYAKIVTALKEGSPALREYRRKHYGWMTEYAFNVQAGHADFDYLTPQLKEASEGHVGWGAGLSFGRISPSRDVLFAAGMDYQRAYKPADDAILCPPPVPSGSTECVSGPIGPPTGIRKHLVWGEVRGAIDPVGVIGPVGYSLRITHDFESNESGIDLPIYFLRNADGKLSGGLRLGWTTEQDLGVGIFLSSPFELR